MMKSLFTLIFSVYLIFTLSPVSADTSIPEVKIKDNNILVSTGISNPKEIENAIKSGVEKELIFSIELFRVWPLWPDEFVSAKEIQRLIKYDNLRGQYRASSYDGSHLKERHFRDFNTLKDWVFTVKDINLANIRELEPGRYFVRVAIESKSRELPPIIGLFMLFIPETEMSWTQRSQPFYIKKK